VILPTLKRSLSLQLRFVLCVMCGVVMVMLMVIVIVKVIVMVMVVVIVVCKVVKNNDIAFAVLQKNCNRREMGGREGKGLVASVSKHDLKGRA
jgi:hypothetical protein